MIDDGREIKGKGHGQLPPEAASRLSSRPASRLIAALAEETNSTGNDDES